jgi:hypothetical protein
MTICARNPQIIRSLAAIKANGANCSPNWPRPWPVPPPSAPNRWIRTGCSALFDSKDTGGDVVLVPATDADMRGKHAAVKASLEVVYDDA